MFPINDETKHIRSFALHISYASCSRLIAHYLRITRFHLLSNLFLLQLNDYNKHEINLNQKGAGFMYKILVMEDDAAILEELQMLLRIHGYQVVQQLPCDLALLDINLPGENGFEVCRKIRETSDIPIIFLTARDSNEDELIGFGVGADDYIRKPYNSSILLARISRLLARKTTTIQSVRGLTLDSTTLKVQYNGASIELTKNETRILASLMKKELLTREEIIEDLWNDSLYIDENTLYVNINRLRDKLKQIGTQDFIKTVRGVGYRL